jgi:hypothetical protein
MKEWFTPAFQVIPDSSSRSDKKLLQVIKKTAVNMEDGMRDFV